MSMCMSIGPVYVKGLNVSQVIISWSNKDVNVSCKDLEEIGVKSKGNEGLVH